MGAARMVPMGVAVSAVARERAARMIVNFSQVGSGSERRATRTATQVGAMAALAAAQG
jgi:hypothetical protein